MAAPGGTFTKYGVVGDREDLSDIIYDISPMDTPFMSNAGRGTARNTLHEWQTDSLAAASDANAHIEGDDASTDTSTPTVRFGNYTQISRKVPRVSGTLRAIDTAGRQDELSYQIAKRGRELKRDIESALLSNNAGTAGAAASARVCAGLGTWLFTNVVAKGADATTPAVTSGVPNTAVTAGTAGTVAEADLKSVIKQCWDNGGNPTVIMAGSFNKQQMSQFSGIGTQFRDVQPDVLMPGSIVGAADVYVSDFGTHQIVANRFQPAGTIYALDMEYFEVAYLRPIQQEDLSKTGDSDRKMLLAEYTLVAKEPTSSGKIYTVTTS